MNKICEIYIDVVVPNVNRDKNYYDIDNCPVWNIINLDNMHVAKANPCSGLTSTGYDAAGGLVETQELMVLMHLVLLLTLAFRDTMEAMVIQLEVMLIQLEVMVIQVEVKSLILAPAGMVEVKETIILGEMVEVPEMVELVEQAQVK